jgi:methylenetetrahydrofolate reductase (NADPH)
MKIKILNQIGRCCMLIRMPKASRIAVSFEFFPPSDSAGVAQLMDSARRLAPVGPRFVSVTYGADGSTRSRTRACVQRMAEETGLEVAPHLTCVAADRNEVLGIAADYWREGRRHIVALRGDAPSAGAAAAADGQGFAYAADLVRALGRRRFRRASPGRPAPASDSGSIRAAAARSATARRRIALGVRQHGGEQRGVAARQRAAGLWKKRCAAASAP